MRLLLFFLFFSSGLAAQTLKGTIKSYPDGKPLEKVSIFTDAGVILTKVDGSFILTFAGKKPGDKIYFTPQKGNYKPTRFDIPISAILPSNVDENRFIIELCVSGKCPEDELYERIQREVTKKIESINKEIQQLPANSARASVLQDSILFLLRQQQEKDALIRDLTKQIVHTDFENALPVTQKAIAYLEVGKIDSAIVVLKSARIPQELKAIVAEEAKLKQQQLTLAEKKKDYINAQLTLARSFALNYELDSAVVAYEIAILADTSNIENLYDYARFLEEINRYDKALHWLQKVTVAKTNTWRIANAWGFMGDVYIETGDFIKAPLAYARYEALYDSLYRREPGNDFYKQNLAISHQYLGFIFEKQGEFDKALLNYQKFKNLLDELFQANPASEEIKKNLAISYEKLGNIYQAQGNFDTALVFFQKYNQFNEELYRDNPKSGGMKNGLAISYFKLGAIHQAQGKFDTALGFFQKYNQFSEELYRDNPKSEGLKNGLAISYSKLGAIYQAQGKFDTALVFFQKDLKLTKELYRDTPKSEGMKNGLAISYSKLGDIYQAQGTFDTALVFFQKQTKLFEELYRDNPKSEGMKNGLAISYEKLGDIYQAQGTFDTALVFFQKRSQLGEELYRDNPKSVELWSGLGVSYYKLGALSVELDKTEDAIGYYERAAQVFREMYAAIGLEDYKRKYEYLEAEIKKLKEPANPLLQKIQTLEQQVEKATLPADKVKYQKELVQLLQGLVDATPDNQEIKAYIANAYGGLAWHSLFTKQFQEAEQAAQRGINLGGAEAEWINSNLALALLYQSKYAAAEAIYKQFKGKPYDKERGWTEVFLADLEELEKAGITHPDVAKVRKLLRE